jgi:hypothetical protein
MDDVSCWSWSSTAMDCRVSEVVISSLAKMIFRQETPVRLENFPCGSGRARRARTSSGSTTHSKNWMRRSKLTKMGSTFPDFEAFQLVEKSMITGMMVSCVPSRVIREEDAEFLIFLIRMGRTSKIVSGWGTSGVVIPPLLLRPTLAS